MLNWFYNKQRPLLGNLRGDKKRKNKGQKRYILCKIGIQSKDDVKVFGV